MPTLCQAEVRSAFRKNVLQAHADKGGSAAAFRAINNTTNKIVVFAYEAFGTGMLLYAVNMTKGEVFGQFGIAFMLFACLLIGGPLTGAHYNPAVSTGVYISNAQYSRDLPMYLIMVSGQIVGGIIGVMIVWATLINKKANTNFDVPISDQSVPVSEIATLLPNYPEVGYANCFLIEMAAK